MFSVNDCGVFMCRCLVMLLCCLVMLCFSVFSLLSRW